jgi:dihydroflavonol-4-reductase
MARGGAGERYLVGGPNWTFAELFGRLERLTKIQGPKLRLPARAARLGARVLEELARAQGRAPAVDAVSVEMAEKYWYLDASKARRAFDWVARDPTETLLDTVRDLDARRTGHAIGAAAAAG